MAAITVTLSLIVCSIIDAFAILLWGNAFYKAYSLWKDKTKKYILMLGIGMGLISAFCYLLYLTTFSQILAATAVEFVKGFKDMQNALGLVGVFYFVYHACMLYIKMTRLKLTQRLGSKRVATLLLVSNVAYFVVVIAYSISYSVACWHPLSVYNTYVVTPTALTLSAMNGFLGVFEVLIGSVVELATIFYLRSVIFSGRKGYSLKDLGFYEYAAVFTAVWALLVHILSILGATGFVDIESSFFMYSCPPSVFLFQSFTCLSVVCSLESVKNEYIAQSQVAQSQRGTVMSVVKN
jgi:hypothetical protein